MATLRYLELQIQAELHSLISYYLNQESLTQELSYWIELYKYNLFKNIELFLTRQTSYKI